METRDILDSEGNKIGELTLPDDTSEEEWQARLAAYTHSPTEEENIRTKIKEAIDVSQKILIDFGVRMFMSGKTIEQMRDVSIKLSQFQLFMYAGSLFSALNELDTIEVDSDFTQEDKDSLKDKINSFLGM